MTRIRIEGSGDDKEKLLLTLSDAAVYARDFDGGSWEIEDGSLEVQTTKDGFWGRITIRRTDAPGDPLHQR